MATLRELRSRISGVRKTQKITRAMKMVAAAKLRRSQMNVVAARPYAREIKKLLQHLSVQSEEVADVLMTQREIQSVALVVVTADRGFAGAFNSNLVKAAVNHVAANYQEIVAQKRLKVFCIGRKGSDFFSKRGYVIAGRYIGVYNNLVFAQAQNIVRDILDGYLRGDYDRVDVIYNEFKSVAQQNIVVEQFLPVPAGGDLNQDIAQPKQVPVNYFYEPSREEILSKILPKHLNFQLWRLLLESNAAEQGARMAAMENATANANELIETLQLQYNKARQAAITKELLEVVSGAEALTKAD